MAPQYVSGQCQTITGEYNERQRVPTSEFETERVKQGIRAQIGLIGGVTRQQEADEVGVHECIHHTVSVKCLISGMSAPWQS